MGHDDVSDEDEARAFVLRDGFLGGANDLHDDPTLVAGAMASALANFCAQRGTTHRAFRELCSHMGASYVDTLADYAAQAFQQKKGED